MDKELYKALRDRELYAIEGNESGHGKNTDHAVAKYGPLKGQQAVGNYAFMPGTVQGLLKVSKNPALQKLKGQDLDSIMDSLEDDPKLQKTMAEEYYDMIYKKHPNDPDARAASWLMGPNRSDAKMHQLMDRFPKIQQYINNFNKNLPVDKRVPASLPSVPLKPLSDNSTDSGDDFEMPLAQEPLKLSSLDFPTEEAPANNFSGLKELMNLAHQPTTNPQQENLDKIYANLPEEEEEEES